MIPVLIISDYLAIQIKTALNIYVLSFAVISYFVCMRIVRNWNVSYKFKLAASIIVLFGFFYFPGYSFGKGAHFFIILFTPYTLIAVSRYLQIPVSRILAIVIGVLAGFSLGFKPHFVLVPIAIEISLFLHARRGHQFLRAESVLMAACAMMLAGYLLLAHPLWIEEILPKTLANYAAYNDLGILAFWSSLLVVPLAGLFLAQRSSIQSMDALKRIFAAAACGGVAVFIFQGKGWFYQAQPAIFFLFLLLCVVLADAWKNGERNRLRRWGIGIAGMCVGLLILNNTWSPDRDEFREVEARLQETTGPFFIMSTNVLPAFQLAILFDREWASRFPCLADLPAIIETEQSGATESEKWKAYLRHSVTADMSHFQPSIVFVPDAEIPDQGLPPGFNTLEWFLRDADFAQEWAHYRPSGKANNYLVYLRE